MATLATSIACPQASTAHATLRGIARFSFSLVIGEHIVARICEQS